MDRVCKLCGERLTWDGSFWRDQDDDPGDGYGGSATCGERVVLQDARGDLRHIPA